MPTPAVTGTPGASLKDETMARVATPLGNRLFTTGQDTAAAPLCDEHGRLIVRPGSIYGVAGAYPPPNGVNDIYGVSSDSGSAPNKSNIGLVVSNRVMRHARFYDPVAVNGWSVVQRMFGYSTLDGWVQLILKDESAGDNPPVITDVPEVTIAIGAGQNFSFGEYSLGSARDFATYIALSTTGPTYTPAGAASLWYYFQGSI